MFRDLHAVCPDCGEKVNEDGTNDQKGICSGCGETWDEESLKKAEGKGEFNHSQVASLLINKYDFFTIEETKEIYYLDNGVLISADCLIEKETEKHVYAIEKEINKINTDSFTKEVKGHIRRRTFIKREEIDKDDNIINIKNGLINLKTGILTKHNKEYPSFIQLPVNYNEKAKGSFIKYLVQWQPNYSDCLSILEEMAYCLLKNTKHQKAFLHVGEGSNGRSTYFAVLEALFGSKNVSHIPIHQIETNKFSRANLDGKIINTYSEISSDEIKHTGYIKAIITGDSFEVEKKGKTGYSMKPMLKLIFSCNRLPEVNNDQSRAWFRRWIIRDWKQVFEGENQDKDLITKLTTEEELSAILNIILPIARKLNADGNFTDLPTAEETKAEWLSKSNIIQSFSDKNLVVNPTNFMIKELVYKLYCVFCKENNYSVKPAQTFFSKLKTIIQYTKAQKRIDGKVTPVLLGISLVSQESVSDVINVLPSVNQKKMDDNYNSIIEQLENPMTSLTSMTTSHEKEEKSKYKSYEQREKEKRNQKKGHDIRTDKGDSNF